MRFVAMALGLGALTGLPFAAQAQPAAKAYENPSRIYAALSRSDTEIAVGGGLIGVTFADGAPGLDRSMVLAWIRRSAEAVVTYFGRFPVAEVGLLIVVDDGNTIPGATTFGYGTSAIRVYVGRAASIATFRDDWILVHEMTHLALPKVPRGALWLQEGNATYVEPIARAQAGQLDAETVWKWTMDYMPGGQPKPGEGGLDGTNSHSRIYWGGAAFWLLSDVRIRQRTRGRIGLQTALRAINRAGGGNTATWSVKDVLRVGDKATGGTELLDLYEAMGRNRMPLDIAELMSQLGVSESHGHIVFDDKAPLAAIRKGITALRSAKTAG
jgi:hypothetical protein